MRSLLALAALLMGSTAALAEVPRVVASIKPVHALVSAVMGELGTPELLVKGTASPHAYSLKPSDAAALQQAQIVFWTGHQFEVFLEDALETLAANAQSVTLGEAPGITLLPAREGGMFEAHDHDHEGEGAHDHEGEHAQDEAGHDHEGEHDHDGAPAEAEGHDHEDEHPHGEMDMHSFLDPENAKAMVSLIEATLVQADSDNAATYAANAEAERQALDALIAEVDGKLAAIKDRPIVVFHDAYQYFGARFGLNIAGSVTVSPESMPGADRISDIREKLKSLEAACVFAEPNFDPRIVGVLVEGTEARMGTLDPEGASLEPGKGLYAELINGLADGLVACLQK